jgi:PilZ domain
MVESRKTSRHRVLKAGTIEFGGGAIDCLVRNLSPTGAALEVSNQIGIPEKFILVVPGDGLHQPCHIAWRKAHRIGVTFGPIETTGSGPGSPEQPNDSGTR